ncbi:hypothetical protein HD554DRAFT_2034304 [Boletus coccyginus]|nr:hypothetical protein HD554DRAFT_2034304 [Boletus coccyginus]
MTVDDEKSRCLLLSEKVVDITQRLMAGGIKMGNAQKLGQNGGLMGFRVTIMVWVGYHLVVCVLPELCCDPFCGQRGVAVVDFAFSLSRGLKEAVCQSGSSMSAMEILEETIIRALSYLDKSQTAVGLDAAIEDQAEELESLVNGFELTTNLKDASKGVVVDTTLSDYANYWNQFKDFTVTTGRVKSPGEIDALFLNIPVEFPTWIALWIMHKCDEINIWTGKAKLPSDPHSTYDTAQKM